MVDTTSHDKPRRFVVRPHPANDEGYLVSEAWPDEIPITTTELEILEAHISDLVAQIAANDNEPPQG